MYKFAFVYSVLFCAPAAVHAQNSAAAPSIPSQVMESFRSTFPEADMTLWSVSNNICFANFFLGQTAMTAQLDTCGNMREYSKKIRFQDLPEPLRISFARDRYARYQIAEVFDINQPGGAPARYFVIVGRTADSLIPLRFTPGGEAVLPRPRKPCNQ